MVVGCKGAVGYGRPCVGRCIVASFAKGAASAATKATASAAVSESAPLCYRCACTALSVAKAAVSASCGIVAVALHAPAVASHAASVMVSVAVGGNGSVRSVAKRPAAIVVITAVKSVAHAHSAVAMSWSVASAMIPRAVAIHVPAVAASINGIEVWRAKVEIVAVRVAGIHAEVPITGIPIQWAIEVSGISVHAVLPVEQNVAQVQIAPFPINTVQVVVVVYTHEVVQVYFVCGFVLVIGQIQLISHLVRQEKSLLASLFITHGVGRYCYCKQ